MCDCSVNSLKGKLAHKKRFKGAGGGKMKIDHKSDMCNWMWYKSDHTCIYLTKSVQTLKPIYIPKHIHALAYLGSTQREGNFGAFQPIFIYEFLKLL